MARASKELPVAPKQPLANRTRANGRDPHAMPTLARLSMEGVELALHFHHNASPFLRLCVLCVSVREKCEASGGWG